MAATLQELLSAWRREYGVRQRCEVTIHPRYASCACLALSVYRHGDDMDYCVRQLAELLRLVELMTRIGVDPRALHQLVVRLDDCPMEQLSCSFCDDVDQRVVVELEPHHSWLGRPTEQSFFGVVRRAVFDWDDATATPAFHDLRDWLLTQASAKDAKRKRPIELHVEVAGVRTTEETELLLRQASDAASAVPFQLSTLRAFQPNRHTVQLMAASQLPVVTTDLDDWRAVRDVEGANGPRINLTALQANAYPRESEVESLYQLVQAHSSQLKKLSAFHGRGWNEGDDHEPQLLALARSLFAPDSPLHLDLLELMAPLGERELQFMLSQLGSTENARSVRPAELRHRSMNLWGLQLRTIRGATLGSLLTLSGGVESLELRGSDASGIPIAEVPQLIRSCRSLRSLDVQISCQDWASIPLPQPSTDVAVSIERLVLLIDDREATAILSAVERLLRVVGRSLKSLSILPHRRRARLTSDLAAVIARECSSLEQLSVRHADESFISTLLASFAGQLSRLKRLSFVTGAISVDYLDLLTALSTPTHAVSRVLRSLHIDIRGQDTEEVDWMGDLLKDMLKTNGTLQDVVLSASAWPSGGEEATRGGGLSIKLPPLRHRLAALSVLRRLNLPVQGTARFDGALLAAVSGAGRDDIGAFDVATVAPPSSESALRFVKRYATHAVHYVVTHRTEALRGAVAGCWIVTSPTAEPFGDLFLLAPAAYSCDCCGRQLHAWERRECAECSAEAADDSLALCDRCAADDSLALCDRCVRGHSPAHRMWSLKSTAWQRRRPLNLDALYRAIVAAEANVQRRDGSGEREARESWVRERLAREWSRMRRRPK
ncbi:hypothetical protein ATCC90586_006946 [Pythium insidiosum]|nr:hypothetical protein ATCC90586_006946 [Pythium insidiosum]